MIFSQLKVVDILLIFRPKTNNISENFGHLEALQKDPSLTDPSSNYRKT